MKYKPGQRVIIDCPADDYDKQPAQIYGVFPVNTYRPEPAYTVQTADKQVHSFAEDELCSDHCHQYQGDITA